MASSSHSSDIRTLRREVEALQQRVSRLELEAHPKGREAEPMRPMSEYEEFKARMDASMEYKHQRDLKHYREHPRELAWQLKEQEKRDAFFRERGVAPPESSLRKVARQLANEKEKATAHKLR